MFIQNNSKYGEAYLLFSFVFCHENVLYFPNLQTAKFISWKQSHSTKSHNTSIIVKEEIQQAIVKTPAKQSSYQISSVIALFVVYQVYYLKSVTRYKVPEGVCVHVHYILFIRATFGITTSRYRTRQSNYYIK
jgi:hypothetical protein